MRPVDIAMLEGFDHNPDIVFVASTDGRIVAANPAACEAFGLCEAEIVERGRSGLVDPGDPRLGELPAAWAAPGFARGELMFVRGDGTRFPGELSSRVVEQGDGAPCRIVVVRDVSERRRAEEALRASEERYRALFNHLSAGVVVHGADAQIVDANPRACEILGLSLEQMRGRDLVDPVWALLREDGSPMTVDEFPVSRVMASGRALDHLVLGIQRPERERPTWCLCNAYPTHDDAGRLVGVVASFVDITERVEAEASLRTSEERLQLVLRGSNDAPWDWDLAGHKMYYSDRWWQMLGYRSGALAADEGLWQRLLHPDDADRMATTLAQVLCEGPDAFEVEFRLRAADGRHVPVLARGCLTRDADGRAVRMSGVNTDLTERLGQEAARRQLEAQLRESQKMESIGTLAGGIAHDFNNLLGAILANAALARTDVGDHPAVQESLAQIEKAGARARTLVQQILSFSRRQAPDMRVQPLQPLVEEALSILRSTLPARVDIAAQLCEQPLHVAADATQLQQVLMNLCTNAWHALHGGAGRVTVGLDRAAWPDLPPASSGGAAARPCAHLWVRDTGRGMAAETLQRVFEPFFTTKAVGEGTGLGLSVAHGIVSAHDGVIRAESEAGGGSCFHVYLPLRPPNDVAAAEAAPPGIRAHGRGELVVYVDDDEVMVHVVDRLLARLGYRTRCFTDGREALAALGGGGLAADLVVSDYNMPGLSGLELATALRTARPGLPVVMSSGFISDALREAASRAGVRALMHKQHTIDELGATIERVLGR